MPASQALAVHFELNSASNYKDTHLKKDDDRCAVGVVRRWQIVLLESRI
jgi:hypothetical protein